MSTEEKYAHTALKEFKTVRYNNSHRSATIVLLLVVAATSLSQSVADVRELELGKPIERELSGGVVHVYSVWLQAEQLLKAVVDQRGIDVVVTMVGLDGKELMDVDSPNGNQGPEPISFIAKGSGTYHIKVRSLAEKAPSGRYEVRVEALRTATALEKFDSEAKEFARILVSAETDRERVTMLAQKKELITVPLVRALYEHSRDFRNQRKFALALAISRLALGLAEQIGDQTGIGDCLYNIGYVFYWEADNPKALEYLQKSLALREELGEKSKAGDVATVIALTYTQQNQPDTAVQSYQKALTLYQAAGDQVLAARAQKNMGQVLRSQGKYAQAFEAFQKCSAVFQAMGERSLLASTLLDIGHIFEQQGNYPPALEYRQKALALGEELGAKPLIATALSQIGWINFLRGDHLQALEYYRKSLPRREALGNKLDIAETLNQMTLAYRLQGDFAKALEHGQRALTLSEPLAKKGLTANILVSIGLVYNAQGNLSQALEAYRRSLVFSEESRDKGLIANALEKIAGINHTQGNFAEALEYYQRSLKLSEELGTKRQIIFGLNAMAWVYRSQGNYSDAMEYYRKSLTLSQELGNKFQIANALNGMGIIYFDQGDFPQAFEYFQRSLKLKEETGNAQGVLASINNIGEVYRAQGDYKHALDFYHRSLSLSEKIGSKSSMTETLHNIGETHLAQANYAQALEYFRRSLALSEELGDKLTMTGTLSGIGSVYASQGNHLQALEFADRAATIAVQTRNRHQLWNALTTAGRAYRGLKRPDEALRALREAISIVESIRSDIAGQGARASYLATAQRPYELYIDVLMQQHKQNASQGRDALALELNERARARSLLETLGEARADIRLGVDPFLLERESSLQRQLNARAERHVRLLNEKHTDEQVAALQKEIDGLTAEYQQVETNIRQSSPRYAALTQPQPLTLREIQKDLLDADTALLEYSLGDERSYLWVVTPTSIKSAELPKRAELENVVRRVLTLISDGNGWGSGGQVNMEYGPVASQLSETLLPAAILSQLKVKRLVIVGDGVLQYLPFSALPKPGAALRQSKSTKEQPGSERLPLITDYEIVSLPSASTLAVLRREAANRVRGHKSVAVLADPVFEKSDERVKATASSRPGSAADAQTASSNATLENSNLRTLLLERALRFDANVEKAPAANKPLRISRLPFTGFEAQGILASAPAG